jgi:XTP/dITP diphosphohydrolase
MALCFATNNRHKLKEAKALLPEGYPLLSLKDIGCTIDLPETQNTLEGNAHQKASYVREHFGVDCFADDTGLEVEALNGAPGVYSARYAGPEKSDQANRAKLLQELKGKEDRQARFRTVICLINEKGVHYFEGTISGTIVQQSIGSQGFGYDSVFQPIGETHTFAQMSSQQKNHMSHRGEAIRKLVQFLGTEV